MSDTFRSGAPDVSAPDISRSLTLLPGWLADRLLRPGEAVTWVCGPRFNPSWERYVTHPGLFVAALALGAACLAAAGSAAGEWPEIMLGAVLAAGGLVIGSIVVLAVANGYFTRLVVTDCRLVILQGYEVCRGWGLDDLPPRLVRYGRRGGGEAEGRAVDLDAVKTMLGRSSDKFVESKTILAFGKQLDRIKPRDKGQP